MDKAVSESELLQASLAGSKEAFGAIVQRYQSLLCAIAYSATGDIGRSEELAQESFLRAWRSLRQLEDLGRFRAWLCTITRNLITQSVRAQPRDVLHGADSLEKAGGVEASTPEPSQVAIDKERQEIVWGAVGRIPLKYREPLVLFYRRQQSVSRVAADLGLSEETVRQRLRRGRQLIQAEVAVLVEDTLARSEPSKAFAIAVVAGLPALITPTASAAVAGIAAQGAPAAKTVFAAGLSGAVLGPILGLLGGLLGAWCGIRNTDSPRERRFMIQTTLLVWLLVFAVLGLPLTLTLAGLIPQWVCWLCSVVFFALLLPLVLWANIHQRRIQVQDGTDGQPPQPAPGLTRWALQAGLSASIFGGAAWLLILAWAVKDWISLGAVLGCDVLIFLAITEFRVRRSQRYWSLAAWLGGLLLGAPVVLWAAWHAGLPRHIGSVIVVSAVGGLSLVLLDSLRGRRFEAWLRRIDRRTVVAGFVAAVVSGLLYSVVHEFGHFIFAVALGGTVKSVTWTIFSSAEPHVSYGHLPASAAPWASAGGYLFPTAVALVLIAAWYSCRRRLSSRGAVILLIPAATLLLCNLGCIPELFEQNSHVRGFASHYGMGKMGEVLVSLLFAGASLAILIAVLSALKNTKSAARECSLPITGPLA